MFTTIVVKAVCDFQKDSNKENKKEVEDLCKKVSKYGWNKTSPMGFRNSARKLRLCAVEDN